MCEAAEKLAEEPDVISAFHQLQKLHQEFRAIGPVAKDLREEIWSRFKAASTVVNKRHQQHFEELKEKEQNNLDQKTVICEIVEGMEYDTFTTFADWEDKTNEILALQAKWKTIGYAPQKMNVKIFERFRAACDEFFRRKAAFFKSVKETMAANLEKKKAFCEKAEALKESTDWKETAEILTKLQKEWKTIGPVAKSIQMPYGNASSVLATISLNGKTRRLLHNARKKWKTWPRKKMSLSVWLPWKLPELQTMRLPNKYVP